MLFIDARKLGYMATRTLRALSVDDSALIVKTYHKWRDSKPENQYEDLPGFCRSASIEEIATHDFVLTPGRYVGAADVQDDGEPIEAKLSRFRALLLEEFEKSDELEKVVRLRLEGLINGD